MFLILLSYLRANTLAHVILDLVRVLLQTGPALNQMLNQFGPAMELSTLGCSSMHNNTLQVLHRTPLGPAPPKADPACRKEAIQ